MEMYEKFSFICQHFSNSVFLSAPVHAINIKIVLTRRRDRAGTATVKAGAENVGKYVSIGKSILRICALHSIKDRDGVTTAPKSMQQPLQTDTHISIHRIQMISSGRTPEQSLDQMWARRGGLEAWLTVCYAYLSKTLPPTLSTYK